MPQGIEKVRLRARRAVRLRESRDLHAAEEVKSKGEWVLLLRSLKLIAAEKTSPQKL